MRKPVTVLTAALLAVSLAACGGSTPDTTSAATSKSETAEAVVEESSPESITLTTWNAAGEAVEVEFPYAPQRLAVMDLAVLDILDNIGCGDRVVGVSKGSSIDYLQDYVNDDALLNLGTVKEADMEAVMECEPDVIFIGGRLGSIYDELSKIAPVYQIKTDVSAGLVQSTAENALAIASLFGEQGQIEALVSDYADRIAALQAVAEGKTAIVGMVNASDPKWTELQALETLVQGIHVALQNQAKSVPLLPNTFPLVTMPLLSQVTLEGKTLEEEDYRRQLKALQKQLGELHNRLYRRRVPVVIAYEGWDAAGKGGNIKRLTEALDPRGYEVHPIASPEPYAKARHYLWRFWTRLPKDGHIAIFDRTWYGRVMVERLEGFCSENDWQRAYNEINEFERELTDWGAVVIKFWVQIDKQTQLLRFNERQNDPAKQWKITEEDWRNREKWDVYETAVNEMLQKTSTANAPWHILESVDKKYARIKALQITADTLEKALR